MTANYGFLTPRGAEFSVLEDYRFLYWDVWNDRLPPLGVLMLNPSKAGKIVAGKMLTDPTVTRCTIRAKRLQRGGVIVGNLYGFIATDPKDMKGVADPVGVLNDYYLRKMAELCPTILLAWGAHAEKGRAALVTGMLQAHPMKPVLKHLGLTKGGQPRHPLYIRLDATYLDLV
jgi:hypothetical protein